jgi:hypothetical protein
MGYSDFKRYSNQHFGSQINHCFTQHSAGGRNAFINLFYCPKIKTGDLKEQRDFLANIENLSLGAYFF